MPSRPRTKRPYDSAGAKEILALNRERARKGLPPVSRKRRKTTRKYVFSGKFAGQNGGKRRVFRDTALNQVMEASDSVFLDGNGKSIRGRRVEYQGKYTEWWRAHRGAGKNRSQGKTRRKPMDETTKRAFLQGVRAELEAFGFEASPEVKELVGEWAASGIALPKPQENSPNTVAHPFTPARESPFPGEGSPEANDGADDGHGGKRRRRAGRSGTQTTQGDGTGDGRAKRQTTQTTGRAKRQTTQTTGRAKRQTTQTTGRAKRQTADDGQGAANDADDGQGEAANDADDGQGEAARLDPVERPIVIVSPKYVIVQADDTENDKYYNYTFDYKDKYNSLTTHTLRNDSHTGKNLYQIDPGFRTNSNGSADVEFYWQAVPTTLRPPATELLT